MPILLLLVGILVVAMETRTKPASKASKKQPTPFLWTLRENRTVLFFLGGLQKEHCRQDEEYQ
jgi:hypothetical protein